MRLVSPMTALAIVMAAVILALAAAWLVVRYLVID